MIELTTTKNELNIDAQCTYTVNIVQTAGNGTLSYTYNPLHNLEILQNGEYTLSDMDTTKLNFDLLHPLQMELQKSYDNSINIIFIDNKNVPRLINSRLVVKDNNTYVLPNRLSNTENIYSGYNDQKFEIQTSLTKTFDSVCTCKYVGFITNGRLACGNYHFYISYIDGDGNSTNTVVETGLISVFLGNDGDPFSVHGGIRDTNSYKGIQLQFDNLNTAYNQLQIIYSRDTSDDMQNYVTKYYRINKKFQYDFENTVISITGYENTSSITQEEFNITQKQFLTAKTEAQVNNRLFLGNVSQNINYDPELRTAAIQILPYLYVCDKNTIIGDISTSYLNKQIETSVENSFTGEYYNSKNIYYNLGYANKEIYRLGVIFIYKNGENSSVYNIRGGQIPTYATLPSEGPKGFTEIKWKSSDDVTWNSNDSVQLYDFSSDQYINKTTGENTAGVVYLNNTKTPKFWPLYSIGVYVPEDVMNYLKASNIIGLKFVRQKRMPLRLCQAYTIPVDDGSNLPLIHSGKNKYVIESFLTQNGTTSRKVNNNYSNRLYSTTYNNKEIGAICPDYIVKMPFFNQLFTGTKFTFSTSTQQNGEGYLTSETAASRNYKVSSHEYIQRTSYIQDVYVVGLQDSQPTAAANNYIYRAKAGDASEAYRYRLIGDLQKQNDNGTLSAKDLQNDCRLVRGLFSPYLGLNSSELDIDTYYDIYYPGFSETNIINYMSVRIQDNSEYYPISDNIDIQTLNYYNHNLYRGDNYICNFTWRVNRNFSDSSAPTNDIIVEENTWIDHFKPSDNLPKDKYGGKTEFEYINRGDINAVKLGSWITIKVESNYNLNLRSIDESNTTEVALYGHGRGFYPVTKMSADGGFKIPDSQQLNDGYNVVFGARVYNKYPDVPYVQNIFTNRIYYSNIYPYNSINNGYRVFNTVNFRDYNFELGSITKILEWYGDLICVLEHGIVYIPVQEKSIAADGTDIHINYNKILPDKGLVLTSDIGSKWQDSIVKTPYGIYGVDTVAKKIWQITGSGNSSKVNIISDFKVEQFLNRNIDLGETDNIPVLGIRNVHSHWNQYKQEVMFTFYDWSELYQQLGITEDTTELPELPTISSTDPTQNSVEKITPKRYQWNLAYNIMSSSDGGIFTTFYTWMPSYVFNIDKCMYSLNEDATEYSVLNYIGKQFKEDVGKLNDWKLTNYLENTDYVQTLNNVWKHGETNIRLNESKPLPTHWYGMQHPFEFEFIVRDDPSVQKIWNNLYIISNFAEPESFSFSIIGDGYEFKKDKLNMYYRQEATKNLWHNMGSKITYDKDYTSITPDWNNTILNNYIDPERPNQVVGVPKSTYFPLYYKRANLLHNLDAVMLDSYHSPIFDWKYLSGSEIFHNSRENNYGITTHIKCSPRHKYGILKSNSEYLEDKWVIQIPKINLVQKNESDWKNLPPLVIDYIPNDLSTKDISEDVLPEQYKDSKVPSVGTDPYWPHRLDLDKWSYTKYMPLRDKWIKIRVRYSGKQLAIISAIRTVYTESFA